MHEIRKEWLGDTEDVTDAIRAELTANGFVHLERGTYFISNSLHIDNTVSNVSVNDKSDVTDEADTGENGRHVGI